MIYWTNCPGQGGRGRGRGGKDLGDKTSIQRPGLVDRVRLRNKAGAYCIELRPNCSLIIVASCWLRFPSVNIGHSNSLRYGWNWSKNFEMGVTWQQPLNKKGSARWAGTEGQRSGERLHLSALDWWKHFRKMLINWLRELAIERIQWNGWPFGKTDSVVGGGSRRRENPTVLFICGFQNVYERCHYKLPIL